MIEINLVPDVKQELLQAQRTRTKVISSVILLGMVALGLVVLLAVWVFGVQGARSVLTDNTIKSESQKLAAVSDISDTLTIQNQLSTLSTLHDNRHINSRLFDILTTINPSEPNTVGINKATLDTSSTTLTIEAQAAGGYPALEVFKKTIAATNFEFKVDDQVQSVPLASDMSDTNRSYGEDSSGAKVLRFTLSFTYPAELFSATVKDAKVIAPGRANVTDSYLGVPETLFTERAKDTNEESQ